MSFPGSLHKNLLESPDDENTAPPAPVSPPFSTEKRKSSCGSFRTAFSVSAPTPCAPTPLGAPKEGTTTASGGYEMHARKDLPSTADERVAIPPSRTLYPNLAQEDPFNRLPPEDKAATPSCSSNAPATRPLQQPRSTPLQTEDPSIRQPAHSTWSSPHVHSEEPGNKQNTQTRGSGDVSQPTTFPSLSAPFSHSAMPSASPQPLPQAFTGTARETATINPNFSSLLQSAKPDHKPHARPAPEIVRTPNPSSPAPKKTDAAQDDLFTSPLLAPPSSFRVDTKGREEAEMEEQNIPNTPSLFTPQSQKKDRKKKTNATPSLHWSSSEGEKENDSAGEDDDQSEQEKESPVVHSRRGSVRRSSRKSAQSVRRSSVKNDTECLGEGARVCGESLHWTSDEEEGGGREEIEGQTSERGFGERGASSEPDGGGDPPTRPVCGKSKTRGARFPVGNGKARGGGRRNASAVPEVCGGLEDESDEEDGGTAEGPSRFMEEAGFTFHERDRRFFLKAEGLLKSDQIFSVSEKIYGCLLPHQREGVAWMFSKLFAHRRGGILADDMGLGKTVQCLSAVRGLMESRLASLFLVIVPTSIVTQWEKECVKWLPRGVTVRRYHGTAKQKEYALSDIVSGRGGGVLITTYGTVRNSATELAAVQQKGGGVREWDLIICDEAHQLKSEKAQISRSVRELKSRSRVLLTGTPLPNRPSELWCLMDFASPGLLGNLKSFNQTFARPIERSLAKNANAWEKSMGDEVSVRLRFLIKDAFLRRLKENVIPMEDALQAQSRDAGASASSSSGAVAKAEDGGGAAVSGKQVEHDEKKGDREWRLPPKADLVVWQRQSPGQLDVYKKLMETAVLKEARKKGAADGMRLRVVDRMKKICIAPVTVLPRNRWVWKRGTSREEVSSDEEEEESEKPERGVLQREGVDTDSDDDDEERDRKYEEMEEMIGDLGQTPEDLCDSSCKLSFARRLLPRLRAEGHRVLIFSNFKFMLDLLEFAVLSSLGLRSCRLDGDYSIEERKAIIQRFQEDEDISFLLMTTKVGGFGLNLTCADRVILLDPSWTPSADSQAIDRAHRLGQKKEVVVYRLLCCGAVEDHMYRLQVIKTGISKTATEREGQIAYFSREDKKKFLRLVEPEDTETFARIRQHAAANEQGTRKFEALVERELGSLRHDASVLAISDQSTLYQVLTASVAKDPMARQEAADRVAQMQNEAYDPDQLASFHSFRDTDGHGQSKGPHRPGSGGLGGVGASSCVSVSVSGSTRDPGRDGSLQPRSPVEGETGSSSDIFKELFGDEEEEEGQGRGAQPIFPLSSSSQSAATRTFNALSSSTQPGRPGGPHIQQQQQGKSGRRQTTLIERTPPRLLRQFLDKR
uniref:Uncharacterized protein n=1 Tax=Chromera velia CCMP2878 TaxID=1169474 RepID=A0A0G4GB31_9ALVE|eukprot:Cvel_21023.t1-p1 / transcript=Cvel_21023.t1 / gene=Cvel_21023 / organism=Chromera_velia_CCMP2878 / gene_product=DNA excision repair protein ERCC-6-like, putative / transcript_product=DNA excision repair protein ERCC-6-like, putative / location=Cvel_scaffold1938:882-15835(-) / protein_length=1365 / sequence_SO=supercontig / SO=protein_coding / is_pseudo=false